jgi:hypothetical protein
MVLVFFVYAMSPNMAGFSFNFQDNQNGKNPPLSVVGV